MPNIDYDFARKCLLEEFQKAEASFLRGETAKYVRKIIPHIETVFQSQTQAYREVLLGCLIARLQNQDINIRQPYIALGENAFSGRTLDEVVINPFLQERGVPCTRGPYLSVFRRSVQFEPRTGLRDRSGYESLLDLLAHMESLTKEEKLRSLLNYLCFKFVILRESAVVHLSRIQRISVEQFDKILTSLLRIPSGGLLPVIIVLATLETIKNCYKLDWTIDSQGINVSDKASGAPGDITISENAVTLLSVEVTERPIDKPRVVATFNTKIAPSGISDYLFFSTSLPPTEEARAAARQYFGQGHEITFVVVKDWVLNTLATIGSKCREQFTANFIQLLDRKEVSSALKVAWNEQIQALVD